MENFGKTAYIIRKLKKKIRRERLSNNFLNIFYYHKHELEIARFGAHAPRAGAVDMKRLISTNFFFHFSVFNIFKIFTLHIYIYFKKSKNNILNITIKMKNK